MTSQAISRNFQFECFDVRLTSDFFPVFDHKFFADGYVFDAALCI